ncbi:MAG: hypothetical protein RR327_04730 [Clostridia bacterium]
MTDRDLIEQLNKKIDDVQLPDRVLDNLLLEMRKQKAENSSKTTAKRSKFRITARMRNAIAVCSVALIMVVAIPLASGTFANKSIPNPTSALNPPTPAPFPYAISTRMMPNVVSYTEIDTLAKDNVALPMNFAKANENTTTIFETDGQITLIKQLYSLTDNKQIVIDVDLSNSNNSVEKVVGNYAYDNLDIMLTNKVPEGGCLKFDFNNAKYYISFQNFKEYDILKEIIDDIQKDK